MLLCGSPNNSLGKEAISNRGCSGAIRIATNFFAEPSTTGISTSSADSSNARSSAPGNKSCFAFSSSNNFGFSNASNNSRTLGALILGIAPLC